jgi:DNA-binding XRE family transcriptional regulator
MINKKSSLIDTKTNKKSISQEDIILGSKLRVLRDGKGMTRKQLAILLHVTPQTIYLYESGRACPSYNTLKKLESCPIGKQIKSIFMREQV